MECPPKVTYEICSNCWHYNYYAGCTWAEGKKNCPIDNQPCNGSNNCGSASVYDCRHDYGFELRLCKGHQDPNVFKWIPDVITIGSQYPTQMECPKCHTKLRIKMELSDCSHSGWCYCTKCAPRMLARCTRCGMEKEVTGDKTEKYWCHECNDYQLFIPVRLIKERTYNPPNNQLEEVKE